MSRRVVLSVFLLLPAAIVSAQSPADLDRFERQLEQIQRQNRLRVDESIAPGERALFDYGAYATFSYLTLDDSVGKSHVLRQYELVGYARLNIDNVHEFYLRGRTVYDDFNDGDSFDGRGDDWVSPYADRFHYRFDLNRWQSAYGKPATEHNLVFQAGRQIVTWGNGLTLSELLDGAIVRVSRGAFDLDLVAAVTYDDVTDFDISRPDFRDDTHRGVFGAMATIGVGEHRLFAYGLLQRDYNGDETLVAGGVTTHFDYNSHYLGIGAGGNLGDGFLYGVELVYEGGTTLSNSFDPADFSQVRQTEDDICAFAMNARLEYLLADPNNTRFGVELILATGDSDRLATNTTVGGNQPGTDDRAFNSLGLLNTGLAFAPTVSNLAMLRAGVSTHPLAGHSAMSRFQIGGDVFVFGKFDRNAPIDEPTSNDRFLGTEFDLFLNWQITSDVALSVRYGVFFPGSAIEGDSSPRNFFYTGVTYAF